MKSSITQSAIIPDLIKAKSLDIVVLFSYLWNYFLRTQKNFAGERTTPDIDIIHDRSENVKPRATRKRQTRSENVSPARPESAKRPAGAYYL